ncbi:MAG: hypothetical protein KBA46_01295 [Candidatus Omnitrophica bacterium]|nr:hypothetical protein [Candidatus Omnitrophota bacterium]
MVINDVGLTRELSFLRKFWKIYKILRVPFPFIKHVDILSWNEITDRVVYSEPQLGYLTRRLRLLYGQEARSGAKHITPSIFSFRERAWEQFIGWLYEDSRQEQRYSRKYYRFFNDFLSFFKKTDTYQEKLKTILSKTRKKMTSPEEAQQFTSAAYFYSLKILDSLYIEKQHDSSFFNTVYVASDYPDDFLYKSSHFIGSLSDFHEKIKEVFVDLGSIRDCRKRVWIILDDSILENDFVRLLQVVKLKRQSIFNSAVQIHIFSERALKLFFLTQKGWILEYFHLSRHAMSILGNGVVSKLQPPSDHCIMSMVQCYVIIFKKWLRHVLYKNEKKDFKFCALNMLCWKVLLEKNVISSTPHELLAIYSKLYHQPRDFFIDLINDSNVPAEQAYFFLRNSLEGLSSLVNARDPKNMHGWHKKYSFCTP